jgi:hypothetical protein
MIKPVDAIKKKEKKKKKKKKKSSGGYLEGLPPVFCFICNSSISPISSLSFGLVIIKVLLKAKNSVTCHVKHNKKQWTPK